MVNEELAKKSAKVIGTDVKVARTLIAEIKGKHAVAIRRAYTDVVNVVEDSSISNLQDARTAVAYLVSHKKKRHETGWYCGWVKVG